MNLKKIQKFTKMSANAKNVSWIKKLFTSSKNVNKFQNFRKFKKITNLKKYVQEFQKNLEF